MRSSIAAFGRRVKRRLFLAAQLLVAAALLWFAGGKIVGQWHAARAAGFGFQPRWSLIVASTLPVLAAYAVLIATWRLTVQGWGSTLTFADATRIWFVSNLGRYVPGKVWQIGAMGMLAQRVGVSPVVATGSAVVVNVVNLLAGVAVVAVTGAGLLQRPAIVIGVAAVAGIAVLAAPRTVPIVVRLLRWLTGRELPLPEFPARPIWIAALTSMAAWVLYGLAFRLFAAGVSLDTTGATGSYIAVFTASYLIGYVTVFAPGGAVVREAALIGFLAQLHLASGGAGVLIAVTSRLWLTVLEVLPGAAFLLHRSRRSGHPKPLGNARHD